MALGITPIAETLLIPRGATFTKTVTVKNNGVAVDLTGATAVLVAKPRFLDEKVLNLTTPLANGIALGGVAGTITIVLTNAQTEALDPAKFPLNYSLRVKYTDDTYDVILNGVVEILPGSLVP